MFIKPRINTWVEIWNEVRHGKEAKVLGSLYALALSAYGVLIKFKPNFVSKAHQTPTVAAFLSFRSWVILTLVIVIFLLLEGAYRVVAKRDQKLAERDKELAEAKADPEHKLRLEVDTKPRVSRIGVQYSFVTLTPEDHVVPFGPDGKIVPIGHPFLAAGLWVRFDNRDDVVHRRVEGITVTLKREDKTILLGRKVIAPDGQSVDLQNYIHVPAGTVTEYYRLDCWADLDKSIKGELDARCFLRVEMEAIKQNPYCVDVTVDWEAALKTEKARVEVRRVGSC
jgi:hypothetical protein